jgi:hypothetical protein
LTNTLPNYFGANVGLDGGNYPPPMARVFAASGDDFEDGLEGVCAF